MISLFYVLFVSFQVINRVMRCFQFIKLETTPLTNNNRDIVWIISVCGYIFRKLIVHVAKFTDSEFTMFSRHYGKKYSRLELLHWWRLRPKSYFRLWTWPKTINKSNQWAIFSLNGCQPRRIYVRSMRSHHVMSDRPAAYFGILSNNVCLKQALFTIRKYSIASRKWKSKGMVD